MARIALGSSVGGDSMVVDVADHAEALASLEGGRQNRLTGHAASEATIDTSADASHLRRTAVRQCT